MGKLEVVAEGRGVLESDKGEVVEDGAGVGVGRGVEVAV